MTFYFYDLETSSGSSRGGRIMQFAGQRTNENLEVIGEPDNILVKLADDIVPEPDAILVHGITPQKAAREGITEAELAAYFSEHVATKDTIFVGFNNIRFDDEFMRQLNYRTFYDPYEWHWREGRSRWDLLDPMRMMRALRPDGIKWPFIKDKPTVKLELLAKANNLTHENAHDALSDVIALIELARAFKTSQPKLFSFLVSVRGKKEVAKIAESKLPFVYTSGKFDSEYLNTTVVKTLFKHPRRESAVVYDLRHDPTEWLTKTATELAEHWSVGYGDYKKQLPLKTLQYNRCPAVAPVTVLDSASKERIGYNITFQKHEAILVKNSAFVDKLIEALDILENEQQARLPLDDDVDTQLYDGFWTDHDRGEINTIRHTDPDNFTVLQKSIKNKRLREMMPLYKARNYPDKLTPEEHETWDNYRRKKLFSGGDKSVITKVGVRLLELPKSRILSDNDKYLLDELKLYIESIIPEPSQE